jgi:preprotein translocase subunit SecA
VHAAQEGGRAAFQAKVEQLSDAEAAVRRDLEAQIRRETDPALKQLLEARLASMTSLAGQALSQIMLSVIDEKWKDHLYDLDQLRAAIQYRAWGQKDPLIEYKQEAYDMFVGLMADVRSTFAERWLKLQIEVGPAPRPGRTVTGPLGGRAAPRRLTPMVASKAAADGLVSGGTATGPLPQPPGRGAGVPVAAANPYAGVGRNDPCPCGSGKKFKKCHGAAA